MFALASLAASLLLPGSVDSVSPPSRDWHEQYVYETVRAGDSASTRVERVSMQYMSTNGVLYMHYRAENERGCEEMGIRCDLDGSNVVASKQEYALSGKRLSDARIWVDDDKVHVEQYMEDGRRKLRSRETEGKPVAAEASLMAMFRFFPFDEDRNVEVLIATFTQHFVTMSVRQTGTETLRMPFGEVECYKLEGIVDLYVTSIKTTYWLTKAAPHLLIRYEGKRGIFLAPTYVTSLSSVLRQVLPAPTPSAAEPGRVGKAR